MEEHEKCGCWAVLKRTVSDASKSSPSSKHSPNSIPRVTLLYDSGTLWKFYFFFIFFYFNHLGLVIKSWSKMGFWIWDFFIFFLKLFLMLCYGDRKQSTVFFSVNSVKIWWRTVKNSERTVNFVLTVSGNFWVKAAKLWNLMIFFTSLSLSLFLVFFFLSVLVRENDCNILKLFEAVFLLLRRRFDWI